MKLAHNFSFSKGTLPEWNFTHMGNTALEENGADVGISLFMIRSAASSKFLCAMHMSRSSGSSSSHSTLSMLTDSTGTVGEVTSSSSSNAVYARDWHGTASTTHLIKIES